MSGGPRTRSLPLQAAPLLVLTALLLVACGGTTSAQTPGTSSRVCTNPSTQVQIIATHGDGRTVKDCVSLRAASSITARLALARTDLRVRMQQLSFGTAVCQVDGEPAPVPADCIPQGGSYWSLWTAIPGGGWSYSQVTVDKLPLHSGQSLGLRFEPQNGAPSFPTVNPWSK